VEKIPAGGGAAAAVKRRPEGQRCWRQASRAGTHVREEEEERGKGSRGLICDFQRIQGPLGKLRFLTATKVK
jgi:hypothetical protein